MTLQSDRGKGWKEEGCFKHSFHTISSYLLRLNNTNGLMSCDEVHCCRWRVIKKVHKLIFFATCLSRCRYAFPGANLFDDSLHHPIVYLFSPLSHGRHSELHCRPWPNVRSASVASNTWHPTTETTCSKMEVDQPLSSAYEISHYRHRLTVFKFKFELSEAQLLIICTNYNRFHGNGRCLAYRREQWTLSQNLQSERNRLFRNFRSQSTYTTLHSNAILLNDYQGTKTVTRISWHWTEPSTSQNPISV